jgi:hypothetical protein
MAREARGGDGDLYLGWHETAEGPRRQAMVDRGSKVRKGGERRAWCGGAEMGARFIGLGRRWWGGEMFDQATAGGALSRRLLLEGETMG